MFRALVLLSIVSALPAQLALPNGNFESGAVGEPPPDWVAPTVGGFQAAITNEGCFEGAQCVVVSGDQSVSAGAIGVLRYTFDASEFTARKLRYRAAVRVEPGTVAQLWFRADRGSGGYSFFDNMADRPIRSGSWTYYTIEAPISQDTASISLGLFLSTRGKAWIDDARLEVSGELLSDPIEPPRPLTEDGLDSLAAFAKLAGYVRYFHPSDQAFQLDWNTFLIQGVRGIEAAGSSADLASRLQALFDPVAPTVRVFSEGEDPAAPADLALDPNASNSVIRWDHQGLGASAASNIYRSERQTATFFGLQFPAGPNDPADVYEAPLARNVRARVPTSLRVSAGRTLPLRDPIAPAGEWTRVAEDRATRLAGVIAVWNVLQHFYPYFDITDVDMPAELRRALRRAAENPARADYISTLDQLLAAVKDGHGDAVNIGRSFPRIPLVWRWIENQAIVVRVKDAQGQGAKPGDRLLAVDGVEIGAALVREEAEVSSATPQRLRYRALQTLTECRDADRMTIEIEPIDAPGEQRTLTFDCVFDAIWSEPRPATVAEFEPGIFYLNVDLLTAEQFDAALPQLQNAGGLIFDMRGYPEFYPPTWVQHLTDIPVQSQLFEIPTPRLPDQTGLTFHEAPFTLPPLEPRLTARTVFVTDASVLSQPETDLDWVEHYKLGEIVGEATAGTTGNSNAFELPAGVRISWTGMRVRKPGGARFHGIGIRPTIPAHRTRHGVAAGRDELLEAALEIARGPKSGPAPSITAAGVVNAATFAGGSVAPGEMVTLFGSGLGPEQLAFSAFDFSGYLENYVGETRVFFDGVQAPMVHASDSQVTVLVLYGVSGETVVRVEFQGRPSNAVSLPVSAAAPGLFAFGGSQAAAVNQNQTFNSETNPASRGEIVTLFATGEGPTSPAALDGKQLPVHEWPVPAGEVTVTFGGVPGEIVFLGVQTGILQINVRVPEGAPAGPAVPVMLWVDGVSSASARTVALN